MTDTISALIPVRDGMPYIVGAIRSLQGQTRPLDEIVVVDDGSQDDTPAVLRDEATNDGRIRVVTLPASGLVAALNRGLAAAQGTWIARLDADDVARPNRIQTQMAFVEVHPNLALVGCAYGFINRDGERFSRDTHLTMRQSPTFDPLHDPNVPHQGVIFKRQAVMEIGGYRDLVPAEDMDLWLRLAERQTLGYCDEALVDVRIRRDGISSTRFFDQRIMWSYVRDCARARRTGRNELDFTSWLASYEPGTAKKRRWAAEYAIRSSAAAWADGKRLTAVATAAKAGILNPASVVTKARRLKRRP